MDYPSPSTLDSRLSLSPMMESRLVRVDETIPEAFKIAQRNRISYSDLKYFLKQSPMIVFVYGSLQLPHEIALCLNKDKSCHDDEDVGYALRMTPATLPYHRVYAIKDRIFPGLLDDGTEEDVADGMVIFGLAEAERRRFDRREGGWYSREERRVYIQMASGDEQVIHAHVYIWAHGCEYLIDRDEKRWSLEEFMQARQKAPNAQPTEVEDQRAYEKSIEEMQRRYALRDEKRKQDVLAEARRRQHRILAEYEKRRQQQLAAYALRQERMEAALRAIENDRREMNRQKEHIYEDSSSDSSSNTDSADPPNESKNPFRDFDGPPEALEITRSHAMDGDG